uniref:HYR domain-containing protein n=1 Tax=Ciona savignyi TaxID=51511 RepID=H2YXX4_CIOSA
MESEQPSNYNIVPTGHRNSIASVSVDMNSRQLYWSEKRTKKIKRALFDGSRINVLSTGKHANSMTIDPQTGNVFLVDDEHDTIMVMSHNGNHIKTIMQPSPSLNGTDIRMITQDVKNRYLYWTDTRGEEGRGQVWRMRLDGADRELVFDNLNWPHAITIDHTRDSLFFCEAKDAMIYEMPLSRLVGTINSTSSQSIPLQHDLSGHLPRLRFYILDIKVHDNFLYFVDGKSSKVERFNLTEGVASVTRFGPPEFFRVTNIAVLSTSYVADFIARIPSPCSSNSMTCGHLCVATSDSRRKCLCADGYRLVYGTACIFDTSLVPNIPPSYGNTCQEDASLWVDSCSDSTIFNWTAPVWTDDKTSSAALTKVGPSETSRRLTIGDHVITYTATDAGGLSTTCRIRVTVRTALCPPPPALHNQLSATPTLCGNQFGSTYVIFCKDPTKVIELGVNRRGENITNRCQGEEGWLLDDLHQVTCLAISPP